MRATYRNYHITPLKKQLENVKFSNRRYFLNFLASQKANKVINKRTGRTKQLTPLLCMFYVCMCAVLVYHCRVLCHDHNARYDTNKQKTNKHILHVVWPCGWMYVHFTNLKQLNWLLQKELVEQHAIQVKNIRKEKKFRSIYNTNPLLHLPGMQWLAFYHLIKFLSPFMCGCARAALSFLFFCHFDISFYLYLT